ncbi:MAG: 30S ribosomal protein S12 methylthiotransferase RimO [Spirochaetota bacterium]|nr:30S ribosomal protein S12 methylthiotransferase RimO [Spirochaetota bacterium]
MFLSSDISFYIISLGCSKNLVDSEKINGEMLSCGFKRASTPEEADIIIINTCGFIEEAKKESIDVIFESINLIEVFQNEEHLLPYYKGDQIDALNFKKKIVAIGCLSKRYYDEILSDIPEIDLLYGLVDDNLIKHLCHRFDIRSAHSNRKKRSPLIDNLPYSYIKISEGCSNNCSYCAIPLIRGNLISFPIDMILHDSQEAVQKGAKELIIIAQDIASYSYDKYRLPDVVKRISDIDGVEWIRLLYCHPDNLYDDIIELIHINKKVVKYIDIPFQHVSKRILKSMSRKGDYQSYYRLVMNLRERIPNIRIRSTFMIGYPGETKDEFSELVKFIERVRLDRIGCFMYSKEENTRASMLKGHHPEEIKRNRYDELMMIQKDISKQKLRGMIGWEVEVMIEDEIDEKTWLGRSTFDAPEVDGVFYLTGDDVALNTIVKAKITSTLEYDLIGELI